MNPNKENLTFKLEKMRFNITQADRDRMYRHLSNRVLTENNRMFICDCLKVIYELSEDSKQKEIILDATYMATRMAKKLDWYGKNAKQQPEGTDGYML